MKAPCRFADFSAMRNVGTDLQALRFPKADPPTGTPKRASKQVILTPHVIPTILRAGEFCQDSLQELLMK